MTTIDLTRMLDKTHEGTPIAGLAGLPVTAIQGVSAQDGEALAAAFGIRTIRDLAKNKYVRMAQILAQIEEFDGK